MRTAGILRAPGFSVLALFALSLYVLVLLTLIPLGQTPLQPDTAACRARAEEIWRLGRASYAFGQDEVAPQRYLTLSVPKPMIILVALATRLVTGAPWAMRVMSIGALATTMWVLAVGWREHSVFAALLFVLPAAVFREHLLWATISQASLFYLAVDVAAAYSFARV